MDSTIKILHLYRKFLPEYTGDGIYYSRLVPLMEKHGTSHIILSTGTDAEVSPANVNDMTVHYLVKEQIKDDYFAIHKWLWRNEKLFDVLHIHTHVSWRFSAYVLSRLMGKAVIFSCSLDDSPGDLIKSYRPSVRRLVSVLMRSVQVFVAISPRLYFMSLTAVKKERVCNIPQGVLDTYRDAPIESIRKKIRDHWKLLDDDILLLNVGSICDRKNTLFLIEALHQINNEKVKLIIIGPELEEEYAKKVDKLIIDCKLENRVVKVGFTPSPDEYYKSCDILVFSSKSEGFSNVYLESMCNALPVVTLYLPGLTDYLFDYGKTGYFSNEIQNFVNHIEKLVADPSLRQQMGQAARNYVLQNYGLEYVAKLYVNLYSQVTGQVVANQKVISNVRRLAISDCSMLSEGPKSLGLIPISIPGEMKPTLTIVIDTESEFDWKKGVSSDLGQVTAISELPRIIDLLGERSALPCLVIDYPVATNKISKKIITDMHLQGVEIGIHLQPWTTPPFAEPINSRNSFSGNLGPKFERVKLINHKNAVEAITASSVRTFKAGRYGASASTYDVLSSVGIDIDLSISPGFDFSSEGGPDWRKFDSRPSWIGGYENILSLPTTSAFAGYGWKLAGQPPSSSLLLSGLKGCHLVSPQRLSPEGGDLQDLKRITRSLFNNGLRVFTLSFHSPSLKPGCTPYTNTAAEVEEFIKVIIEYVDFFKDEIDGRVMLPTEIRSEMESYKN